MRRFALGQSLSADVGEVECSSRSGRAVYSCLHEFPYHLHFGPEFCLWKSYCDVSPNGQQTRERSTHPVGKCGATSSSRRAAVWSYSQGLVKGCLALTCDGPSSRLSLLVASSKVLGIWTILPTSHQRKVDQSARPHQWSAW